MRIVNPFYTAPLRWDVPPPFTCGGDDGIPWRMERTHALGNAVVPQIPELIGHTIHMHENHSRAPALAAGPYATA